MSSAEQITSGPHAAPPPAAPAAPHVGDGSVHASPLAHHFRDLKQQHEIGVLGMWLFLATELLFFGGVLTAFEIYHYKYPEEWKYSSALLVTWIGAVNTLVLLCSSLTMALAVSAARAGQGKRTLQTFLAATMALGLAFLVLKGYEYYKDYEESLVPNLKFHPETAPKDELGKWPERLDVHHAVVFFSFYFVLTGIHAAHMVIGLVLMIIVFAQARRYGPEHYTPVDALGLYWHFVDIVWVFLLPLLYLVR